MSINVGAPRDFDISPDFEIVKPPRARHFDLHNLDWADDPVSRADRVANA